MEKGQVRGQTNRAKKYTSILLDVKSVKVGEELIIRKGN